MLVRLGEYTIYNTETDKLIDKKDFGSNGAWWEGLCEIAFTQATLLELQVAALEREMEGESPIANALDRAVRVLSVTGGR